MELMLFIINKIVLEPYLAINHTRMLFGCRPHSLSTEVTLLVSLMRLKPSVMDAAMSAPLGLYVI